MSTSPPATTFQLPEEPKMEGAAKENAAAPVVTSVVAPEAAGDADQRVEDATVEDPPTVAPEGGGDMEQIIKDVAPKDEKNRNTEVPVEVTPEEMKSIIEVIADTGKFWHDWSFLKGLLSLQLKQALAGYSEVQMMSQEDGQQKGVLGETDSELVNRLNDALMRFEEGPPFTLQRLCEILLDPKGTYAKLSKLALALEKNLLVTSTMTKCTDPYPAAHGGPQNSEGAQIVENISAPDVDVEPVSVPEPTVSVSNGTEHTGGDGDEEMADAEAEEVSCSHDVEMQDEKPDQVLNVNPDANSDGTVGTTETVNASEPSSDPRS